VQKKEKDMLEGIKKYLGGIKKYCKDSYEELVHKTTWPSRSELMNSAVVVLTASLCIALVIFCMDEIFQNVMEGVYGILR
jgi:preprotein translocase subunit SecE